MSQAGILGIDLGTTNSCIAYVDENGKAVVIPNSEGDLTTPSVVQFEGTNRIVGKEAKACALLYPDQVFQRVKLDMGKAGVRYSYEGTEYTPEEISSYILRKLIDDARVYLNAPINEVVITCPAYFGIAQREATIKAGMLAGVKVREVVNEPTAAAILYGLSQQEDQVAIVYDLGGGTFDVTVIEIRNGAITVIATDGNTGLGGFEWDMEVMMYLDDQWMAQTGRSDSPSSSHEYSPELQNKAEEAKKSLSARQKTQVMILHAGLRVGIEITRDTFHKKTAHLLQKTIDITKTVMHAARERGVKEFHQIILVGGSTRMPQVKEQLEAEFPMRVRVFDPDLAVAKGVALYGQKIRVDEEVKQKMVEQSDSVNLMPPVEKTPGKISDRVLLQVAVKTGQSISTIEKTLEMKVVNVASHSFGVMVKDVRRGRQIISNIVIMNDQLPVKKTRVYRTAEEDQENVEFQIMENSVNKDRVEDITQGEEVGYAILLLPTRLPQYSPIEVSFELQRDGRLQITGREPGSNTAIEVEIKTTQGVSEKEFQQILTRVPEIRVL